MEKNLKQVKSDCIKVVLYGPESSGKTTITKKLSEHYNCLWVKEYARDFLQKKWDTEKKICELQDIIPIAKGQMELENRLVKKSSKIIICDTDLLETMVYSETYFDGYCDANLKNYAINNTYSLYLLTNIDIPWVKDDLRDRPNEREHMLSSLINEHDIRGLRYSIISGDKPKRLDKAIEIINNIL